MLPLTTMITLPTLQAMKLTKSTILVTGHGRGRAEACHALAHDVITAGCREEILNRIRKFFASFATGAEGRSEANLPGAKTSSLSSVTTPHGPWVYTVVPWED